MNLKNLIKKIVFTYFKKDSHYYNQKKIFVKDDHRNYIGGRWDEIGKLQFNFLKKMGLKPQDKFIDVGCGSLRGGVHFIEFLDNFNYFGTEINEELVNIGIEKELNDVLKNKITSKNFIISENFDLNFNVKSFDYGIALSVFTHLKKKNITRCLTNLSKKFIKGKFYATFFIVDNKDKKTPCKQLDGFTSYPYKDPFHYTLEEINEMADLSGFKCKRINDFIHPRNQKMVEFFKS